MESYFYPTRSWRNTWIVSGRIIVFFQIAPSSTFIAALIPGSEDLITDDLLKVWNLAISTSWIYIF